MFHLTTTEPKPTSPSITADQCQTLSVYLKKACYLTKFANVTIQRQMRITYVTEYMSYNSGVEAERERVCGEDNKFHTPTIP